MEDAFWNSILEELDRDDDAPDYRRVVGLLAEMRSELEKLVPEAWREELHECMDVEIFSQVNLQPIEMLLVSSFRMCPCPRSADRFLFHLCLLSGSHVWQPQLRVFPQTLGSRASHSSETLSTCKR
jgi:hypothetical protein